MGIKECLLLTLRSYYAEFENNRLRLNYYPSEEAIHDLRVSQKRISALTSVFSKVAKERGVSVNENPEIRSLYKYCGRVRDLQVLQIWLSDPQMGGWEHFREWFLFIEGQKSGFRGELETLLKSTEFPSPDQRIEIIQSLLDDFPEDGIRNRIHNQTEKLKEKIRQALITKPDDHLLHRVRRWVKQILYYLTLLEGCQEKIPTPQAIADFQRGGKLLGEWHDLVFAGESLDHFLKEIPEAFLDPVSRTGYVSFRESLNDKIREKREEAIAMAKELSVS